MHSIFPFSSCFYTTLISGTIISLTANRWLTVWLGLELNLISFLPIILLTHRSQETESAIKYFLIQALGSGFVLMGGLGTSLLSVSWAYILISMGLIIKLGLAPLHFWLPRVMGGINWLNCLILTTWQKVAPLFLCFSLLTFNIAPILCLGALSSIVGGVGGINQTNLRALLAYSSIGHVGWLVIMSQISALTLVIYFSVYILVSAPLFFILLNLSGTQVNQVSSIQSWPLNYIVVFALLLLSLGGIPPLTGFIAKWFAIQSLVLVSGFTTSLLIAGSLISLYYYLVLFFSLVTRAFNAGHFINLKANAPNLWVPYTLVLPLAGLGLVSFL